MGPITARNQHPVACPRCVQGCDYCSTPYLPYPGWTIFDKLYILKGIVYVVSDHPSNVPDIRFLYSKALNIEEGKEAEDSRLPDASDIQVISTKQAAKLFGTGAHVIDGVSVCFPLHIISAVSLCVPRASVTCERSPTVVSSFQVLFASRYLNTIHLVFSITHYYHWSAELWFGFWRTYTSLDHGISADGNTTLPPARRVVFNHLDNSRWRDYASMNEWVLRSSFPSAVMEFSRDWEDRTEMGRPFVFERVVVADRSAAMLGYNYARYQRTAGPPNALPGNMNWWQPIRNNVVEFAGLSGDVGGGTTSTPVITYISRQEWGRRMLRPQDHDRLVTALERLRDEHGYEVNIVTAEKMSRVEQIRLAARTTVCPPARPARACVDA